MLVLTSFWILLYAPVFLSAGSVHAFPIVQTQCNDLRPVICPKYGTCCSGIQFCAEELGTCEECFPLDITTREERLKLCSEIVKNTNTRSMRHYSCGTACYHSFSHGEISNYTEPASTKTTKDLIQELKSDLQKQTNIIARLSSEIKDIQNQTKIIGPLSSDIKDIQNQTKIIGPLSSEIKDIIKQTKINGALSSDIKVLTWIIIVTSIALLLSVLIVVFVFVNIKRKVCTGDSIGGTKVYVGRKTYQTNVKDRGSPESKSLLGTHNSDGRNKGQPIDKHSAQPAQSQTKQQKPFSVSPEIVSGKDLKTPQEDKVEHGALSSSVKESGSTDSISLTRTDNSNGRNKGQPIDKHSDKPAQSQTKQQKPFSVSPEIVSGKDLKTPQEDKVENGASNDSVQTKSDWFPTQPVESSDSGVFSIKEEYIKM